MKRWTFLLLCAWVLVGAGSSQGASDGSGLELLRQCEGRAGNTETLAEIGRVVCATYISGMLDAFEIIATIKPGSRLICQPGQGIQTEQAVLIVAKWLRDHPAQLNDEARGSVAIALAQAFPCR